MPLNQIAKTVPEVIQKLLIINIGSLIPVVSTHSYGLALQKDIPGASCNTNICFCKEIIFCKHFEVSIDGNIIIS